mgnify:CR=1 FL=1
MIWKAFLFPRYKLITLPTPLEKAMRLSKELNVDLYIKRDDVMELALGGNKARKLEFILGDALSKGCDTLITRGAFHSNHARLTAAAGRKAGLDVYLVLTPPGSPKLQGNVLLDNLLGAKIVYAESYEEADKTMNMLAKELREKGNKPYIIPGGGAFPYGVLGYVTASLEIVQQLYSLGKRPQYIVHATGTGATQAGLVLGMKLLGLDDVEIIGISISRKSKEAKERVSHLVNETARLLNVDVKVDPEEITVFDNYIFGGYAVVTKEVVDVMKSIAKKEGLVLDPVYTAKAMIGLIDLINKGYIKKNSTVVFIHTGGTPILFQLSHIIEKHL